MIRTQSQLGQLLFSDNVEYPHRIVFFLYGRSAPLQLFSYHDRKSPAIPYWPYRKMSVAIVEESPEQKRRERKKLRKLIGY